MRLGNPLSENATVPPRQDLTPFWRHARDACLALGPQIDPMVFGAVHIERIAPVILGEPVWNLLENGSYAHWEDLVVAVEEAYGLTCEQCIEDSLRCAPQQVKPLTSFGCE